MSKSIAQFALKRLSWPEDQSRLESFLSRTNAWMLRPLSNRVEIPAFAAKIMRHGVAIFALTEAGEECGVVAYYCNDLVQRVGFITLLSVRPDVRDRGLGRCLLERALHEMRAARMARVKLQVAAINRAAIDFYLSRGFHHTESEGGSLDSAATIFMEKTLEPDAGR